MLSIVHHRVPFLGIEHITFGMRILLGPPPRSIVAKGPLIKYLFALLLCQIFRCDYFCTVIFMVFFFFCDYFCVNLCVLSDSHFRFSYP